MNSLTCTLYVDTWDAADRFAIRLAEMTEGSARFRDVSCAWAEIGVGEDAQDYESWKQEPDEFVNWHLYLDVCGASTLPPEAFVARLGELMEKIHGQGIRVVAACEFSEQLPGQGSLL